MASHEDIPPLPTDYESWSASQKESYLWEEKILPSRYHTLPRLTGIDVVGLFMTSLLIKMERVSDQVTRNWKKAIHAHGTVAKVRYTSYPGHKFTGMFQGAEHGLLRLSVTGDPTRRGFAPGLALKLLRDNGPSANVSALVSLTGQKDNYNFFANELSNIVPVIRQIGPKIINLIFRRVTRYPTKLHLENLAQCDQSGRQVDKPEYPEQLFFVPGPNLSFSESPDHDFRVDLATLPVGTVIYEIFAPPSEHRESIDNRSRSSKIGELTLKSKFETTLYGDEFLFFRHQRFNNR